MPPSLFYARKIRGAIEIGCSRNSGLPGYVWSIANWLSELEILEHREPPPRTFRNFAWCPVTAKCAGVALVHGGTVRLPRMIGYSNAVLLQSAHKRIVAQAGADAAGGYAEVSEDVEDRNRATLSPLQIYPICERVTDPHCWFRHGRQPTVQRIAPELQGNLHEFRIALRVIGLDLAGRATG